MSLPKKYCRNCKKILNINDFPICIDDFGFGLKDICASCILKINPNLISIRKRYLNKPSKSRKNINQFLDREITSLEIVHHIDENPKNNELTNLYLCKNPKEHFAIHRYRKSIKNKLEQLGVSLESYNTTN